MTKHPDLTTAPIPHLIRSLAIPAGTGFFFNTMFNVVDTWYAGKISTSALAALSLAFPVFFIILAVGSGIGSGATSLIGNAIGAGDRDDAHAYVLQTFSFGLLHALTLSIAGFLLSPTIFRLMGASGDYLLLAGNYMRVIFAGCPFFLANFTMNAILSATGDTVSFRNFLIVGFLLNLVFDPWLMYGGFGMPALGLSGIGIGTVVIQAMGSIYMALRLARSGMLEGARWQGLIPQRARYWALFRQGAPAALNMMTVTLGIFIITWFVGRFGTEAVAAYGIASRIEQIALLPVMGLNVSTLALVAQNCGAKQLGRVREVIRRSLSYGVGLALVGTGLVFIFTRQLMAAFSADSAVICVGANFLQIEAFVFAAYVILYISVASLQGMKRPFFALWVGLYRQMAAPFLLFPLLSEYFGLGIFGVWWSILVITWSAALFALWYIQHTLERVIGCP